MLINKELYIWLKQRVFWSWAKKYQRPEIFESWLKNLTLEQIQSFNKQYQQDKLQSCVQKDTTKTV